MSSTDYKDLSALFLNCTLKKQNRMSHTRGIIDLSVNIMEKQGIKTEVLRPVEYNIAPGVQADMTEYGWSEDEWPVIFKKVMNADILVVCTPIWLGEKSSVCSKVMERLYAHSAQRNDKGQYLYYGKVGGMIISGNEDGIKHCAMNLSFSLQHLGYTIPPQADCGWIGEAGPGPSYLDDNSSGPNNDFTNRNLTFMTWNLIHLARMLKDNGGIPSYGNSADKWGDGERFGFEKLHE